MNSINNTPSNINFTARMELSPSLMKKNAERLKNIAKIFEDNTQKYPTDVFEIEKVKYPRTGDAYNISHHDKGFEHENSCDIPVENWNELFEKSDEYIAKKFVKLFNIFKKKDNELDKAGKYIVSVIKKEKTNAPTEFEGKFWNIVIDKANSDRNLAVIKDPVIQNWDVY